MAAKRRAGRPVNGYPLITFNVSIGLHPVRHAHIIARLNAAPKGKKSSVIVSMMETGSSVVVEHPVVTESAPVAVTIEVSSDGF